MIVLLLGCGVVGAGDPVVPNRPGFGAEVAGAAVSRWTYDGDAWPIPDLYGDGVDDLALPAEIDSGPLGQAPAARFVGEARGAAVVDLDRDGRQDVVVGREKGQSSVLSVWFDQRGGLLDLDAPDVSVHGSGRGAFPVVGASDDEVWLVAATDNGIFTNDLYLFAGVRPGQTFDLETADTHIEGSDCRSILVGEWDGDGYLDLLARCDDAAFLYHGPLGAPWLPSDTIECDRNRRYQGQVVDAGDQDGDGYQDLVFTDTENHGVWYLRGPFDRQRGTSDADAGLSAPDLEQLGTAAASDVDGDGVPEIFLGVEGGLWQVQGDLAGQVTDGQLVWATPSDTDDVAPSAGGDLDGDGRDDLLVAADGQSVVLVWPEL